jgi:hypothetical protein
VRYLRNLEKTERQKKSGACEKPLTFPALSKMPVTLSLERSTDQAGERSVKEPADRKICARHGGSHSYL